MVYVFCVCIRVCAIEIIPWDKGVKRRREASRRFPNPGSLGRTLRRRVFKSHPQELPHPSPTALGLFPPNQNTCVYEQLLT